MPIFLTIKKTGFHVVLLFSHHCIFWNIPWCTQLQSIPWVLSLFQTLIGPNFGPCDTPPSMTGKYPGFWKTWINHNIIPPSDLSKEELFTIFLSSSDSILTFPTLLHIATPAKAKRNHTILSNHTDLNLKRTDKIVDNYYFTQFLKHF